MGKCIDVFFKDSKLIDPKVYTNDHWIALFIVFIMKIKFKQWWSTIPPISTKPTIPSHIQSFYIKDTMTYVLNVDHKCKMATITGHRLAEDSVWKCSSLNQPKYLKGNLELFMYNAWSYRNEWLCVAWKPKMILHNHRNLLLIFFLNWSIWMQICWRKYCCYRPRSMFLINK
jgi:hypothetical protein